MPAAYSIGDQPVPGAGYRLAKFLGRGGFGEVWKATAPGGAEAAVKIIRLGSREGRKELRALQLVKRIHHTHLVPIIAFWIKNDKGEILDDEAVLRADQRDTVADAAAVARTAMINSAEATARAGRPGGADHRHGPGRTKPLRPPGAVPQRGPPWHPRRRACSAIWKTVPRRSTSSTARSTTWDRDRPPSSTATSSRTTLSWWAARCRSAISAWRG